MAGTKSGKKEWGKKGSQEKEISAQQGVGGVNRNIFDADEPSTINLSDNKLQF